MVRRIFIVVAGFNSFNLLPHVFVQQIIALDTILLATAMVALGLTTHVSAIRQAGIKPLLMALILFVWLIVGGLLINILIQSIFSIYSPHFSHLNGWLLLISFICLLMAYSNKKESKEIYWSTCQRLWWG